MKQYVITIIFALLGFVVQANNEQDVRQTPLPDAVIGVTAAQSLLNGTWQLDVAPAGAFEKSGYKPAGGWKPILVPGECAMQGYAIEHDKPVLYRKQFTVPADFKGKKSILRFDGVYSYARLFVNGTFVRAHHGGFTRWESDVTPYLKPGKTNELKLEVTDCKDDISYGSGYAHHPIGGILRDVLLYALPVNHIDGFVVETKLDSSFCDASLNLSVSVRHQKPLQLQFTLLDPQGKQVALANPTAQLPVGTDALTHKIAVAAPQKWDAEHPNLYTLRTVCMEDEKESYAFTREIGFRDIRIKGNELFVNGQPVKLRGACRHDIHPTLGRTTTPKYDSLDVALFRKSNMNFVRTSHYPPTERFLAYCDKAGLYVECETAICFVDTYRQKNYAPAKSQSDAAFSERYMGQLQEMVVSMRNHASILFWSIGNESMYGSNFRKSYDWTKATDTTRPIIFSYPGTVPTGTQAYDIISMHYPGVNGTLTQFGTSVNGFQTDSHPSLFDEWAHVPCYTYTTLRDDPNIREFWGISLDKMWSNLFESRGGLGGAIWGFIDETFMLPPPRTGTAWWETYSRTSKPLDISGACVGYGEWGIIDVWRREKPEFWGTKKAYSPIRLPETTLSTFTSGQPLLVPVYNRFDHTNLDEVSIRYTYKDGKQAVVAPSVSPRKKGVVTLPAHPWQAGDEVFVEFLSNANELIDAYTLTLGAPRQFITGRTREEAPLQVEETAEQLLVKGSTFTIPFQKQTGLIKNAVSQGKVILSAGPFLNLDLNFNHNTGAEAREKASNYIVNEADWVKTAFSYKKEGNGINVLLSGTYKGVAVNFTILVEVSGQLIINYVTQGEPNGWLREAGIKFHLPSTFTELQWTRKPYWSYYPQGHFGAATGQAPLYNNKTVRYGENPNQPWDMDTRNYYYFANAGANSKQPLTQVSKGMKENIRSYILSSADSDARLQVSSPAFELACRLNNSTNEQLTLYINNRWDYPEIAWGDYCKALDVTPCYGKIIVKL